MASQFNQFDWYWSVQDNNPSGLVYGTKPGTYVPLTDADYVAWLAKDGGNQPTTIDTNASLRTVLNNFAISNYFPSAQDLTLTANVTLINPPPNLVTFTNNTGASLKIIMPVANAPNSIPIGVPIVFRNVGVGAGAFAVAVYASDGTTVLSGVTAAIEPGMTITAVPTSNNSKLGGWNVRNTGNVSAAGVSVVGQYARWATPFTLDSVPPSTVRNDIQAYPVTGGILTGNPIVQKANAALILQKTASGQQSFIDGGIFGNTRWRMCLGDAAAESTGNLGSDFSLQRWTDGGVAIDFPLTISRASGGATFAGNVVVSKASPTIVIAKAAVGEQNAIAGRTGASTRWVMLLGDEFNESGSNAGSSFRIDAYSDAGAYRSSPLTIGRNTGAVVLSNDLTVNGNLNVLGTTIGKREVLTANRSYYVRTDGSDSNNGLANTSGGAFLTIQKAIDVTCGLDTGIYNVGINVADGTYAVTGTALTLKTITGAGGVSITGNTTTPTNCVIAATSGFCVYAPGVRGTWTVNGFHLKALTAGFDNVLATQMSLLNLSNLRFEGLNAHVHATFGAVIVVQGSNYSVAGNFNIHLFCDSHSTIQEVGCTYTAIGTPAIGQAWAWCTQGALIITNANTYTACVCTGPRYFVSGVSYVNTGTAGNATYFPGSTAGSVATGGIYD
jgi:hypothetical protein